MAELQMSSVDLGKPVDDALKGNFRLVKPNSCLSPESVADLQADNERNTISLDCESELDGYATALSECDDSESCYQECLLQSEKFSDHNKISKSPRILENSKTSEIPNDSKLEIKLTNENNKCLPERTATDQFVFRNKLGELKRFQSSLQWTQASAPRDKNAYLDCAAQISTRDLTCSEEESSVSCVKSYRLSRRDKRGASLGVWPHHRSCPSTNYTTTVNNWLSSDCPLVDGKDNAFEDNMSSCTGTGDGNSTMVEAVDNLISRLEQLMLDKYKTLPETPDTADTMKESILNKPLGELSPNSKKEVHGLLQEAADSMDVGEIDIESSQSSLELVWSIVKEAGRRFGFGEDDWPVKLLSEGHLSSRADDMITSEKAIPPDSQPGGPASSHHKTMSARIHPNGMSADSYHNEMSAGFRRSCSYQPSTTRFRDEICSFPPNLKHKADKPFLISGKCNYKSVPLLTKAQSVPNIKCKEESQSSIRNRDMQEHRLQSDDVIFDKPRYKYGGKKDLSSYHQTTAPTGTIVNRKECIAPKTEEYFTCRQILQDTKGVKASLLAKRKKANRKKVNKKDEDKVPRVVEFKTCTKAGRHSYYEILNTRMTIPTSDEKKVTVEATVPVPLSSEAVWINGELFITLKELDRDLAHLPLNERANFTRLPKSIAVEFIREFKQDKSKSATRKAVIERTCSPIRDQHTIKHTSPRPFNTKVDFILKKDPMVLGTLDSKKFSRKLLKQQQLGKSRIPTFCVV